MIHHRHKGKADTYDTAEAQRKVITMIQQRHKGRTDNDDTPDAQQKGITIYQRLKGRTDNSPSSPCLNKAQVKGRAIHLQRTFFHWFLWKHLSYNLFTITLWLSLFYFIFCH